MSVSINTNIQAEYRDIYWESLCSIVNKNIVENIEVRLCIVNTLLRLPVRHKKQPFTYCGQYWSNVVLVFYTIRRSWHVVSKRKHCICIFKVLMTILFYKKRNWNRIGMKGGFYIFTNCCICNISLNYMFEPWWCFMQRCCYLA